ncbi:MAG TPA: hypothetical protein VMW56_02985 [Candidatus Margulisiibacteriota bacterium]|nr:hypothetical protein [Candidatus Margulisiibacteriota bacterium]
MRWSAVTVLLCGIAALAGCAATAKQPFNAQRCARTCIEMADACKASCVKAVDPTGAVRGSRETCERTCQTQRDTCDIQCLQGKEPSL